MRPLLESVDHRRLRHSTNYLAGARAPIGPTPIRWTQVFAANLDKQLTPLMRSNLSIKNGAVQDAADDIG